MSDKLLEINRRLSLAKSRVKFLQRKLNKEKAFLSQETKRRRKERVTKLIRMGAIFEILNLEEADKETMIGYLSDFNNLSEEKKEELKNIGTEIFIKHKNKEK